MLNVPAIVLANLCVSYIMTSQNEAAEELMRKIEKEEERLAFPDQRSVHHLCIVNLVIGTLYCAKGNFEFGIARIVKSLEPYDKKLGADTWYVPKQLERELLTVFRDPCVSKALYARLPFFFFHTNLKTGTTPSAVSWRWRRTWPSTW